MKSTMLPHSHFDHIRSLLLSQYHYIFYFVILVIVKSKNIQNEKFKFYCLLDSILRNYHDVARHIPYLSMYPVRLEI